MLLFYIDYYTFIIAIKIGFIVCLEKKKQTKKQKKKKKLLQNMEDF